MLHGAASVNSNDRVFDPNRDQDSTTNSRERKVHEIGVKLMVSPTKSLRRQQTTTLDNTGGESLVFAPSISRKNSNAFRMSKKILKSKRREVEKPDQY